MFEVSLIRRTRTKQHRSASLCDVVGPESLEPRNGPERLTEFKTMLKAYVKYFRGTLASFEGIPESDCFALKRTRSTKTEFVFLMKQCFVYVEQ